GEERDEVIEKAVKAFERIEAVDTELAERLVEQGILSYDDLSVMEIADLVNTIEGLTEEQAMEIVSRAEALAEEQTEELPRRKGSRSAAEEILGVAPGALPEGEEFAEATAATSDPSEGELPQTQPDASTAEPGSALPAAPAGAAEGELPPDEAQDWERDEASDDEIHDVALAVESSGLSGHRHQWTFPPPH